MNKALVVMALSIGICIMRCDGETDLFVNGDFEKMDTAGKPAGWHPLEYGMVVDNGANNTFYLSGDAHQGAYAAEIRLDTLTSGWTVHPVEGLKPNSWYGVSAWVKGRLDQCAGDGPKLFVLQHVSNGVYRLGDGPDKMLGSRALERAPDVWKQIELAFKTPADSANLYIGFGLYQARGRLLLDDLRVEAITGAEDGRRPPLREAATAGQALDDGQEKTEEGEWLLPGHAAKVKGAAENGLRGKNLVRNGSFEVVSAPDVADCWVHVIHVATFDPDIRENFKVVTDRPFHGRRCFRLKGNAIHFEESGLLDKCATNGVLSLYLRSDDTNAEIRVACNESKTFKPDREWKRYTLAIPKLKSNYVNLLTKGRVFIDAVKLEVGGEPTPFSDNVYERIMAAVPLPAPESPVTNVPVISFTGERPPWDKGLSVDLCSEGGGAASMPTRCVLLRGAGALHVLFECRGRPFRELIGTVPNRDGPAFADDAVCVALNPGVQNGAKDVYQFLVNSRGVQRDVRGFDPTWNAVWTSGVEKISDGYAVTFAIPFAALEDGIFWGARWQINLIRYSAAKGKNRREVSAWFNPTLCTVEDVGVAAAGFGGLDRFRVRLNPPAVQLSDASYLPLPSHYSVEFDLGLAETNAVEGTASLTLAPETRWNASWRACNGKGIIAFQGLTANQVRDLKNYKVEVRTAQGPIATRIFEERLEVPALVTKVMPDRSYYTGETVAHVRAVAQVTDELAGQLEWDLNVWQEQVRLWRGRFPARSKFLEFPVAALTTGMYRVTLNLVRGEGSADILAGTEFGVDKLPPWQTECKYDPICRLPIIDGKPFISFGPDVPINCRPDAMATVSNYVRVVKDEMPQRFTRVICLLAGGHPDTTNGYTEAQLQPVKTYLDACREAGLKVIIWLSGDYALDAGSFIQAQLKVVAQLKDRPEIIGWNSLDECYGHWPKGNKNHKESDLLDWYAALKRLDPYRLYLQNSVYCGRMYGGYDCADMISGSFYTIGRGGGASGVWGYQQQEERERERADRRNVTGAYVPMWPINWEREPSPQEAYAMTYMVLISGGRHIGLYTSKPLSSSLWDSYIGQKKEIEFLTPVFTGESLGSQVRCSSPRIVCTAWRYQGKVYLLALNLSYQPVPACAFDLSSLGGARRVRVCFEDRDATLEGGLLTDRFEGLERHVYEIP